MPRIFLLPFVMLFCLLYCCAPSAEHDIYKVLKRNTKLNCNLVKQSEQIYLHEGYTILMFDIAEKPLEYSPHLLFFDRDNNQLQYACYFSSEYIDSISEYNIYGKLNHTRFNYLKKYRNDLPPYHNIAYTDVGINGWGRKNNKIIKNYRVKWEEGIIALYLKKSKSISIDVSYYLKNQNSDTLWYEHFNIFDTINVGLCELHLNYSDRIISIPSLHNDGSLAWDHMSVLDEKLLNSLFQDICTYINSP